MDIAHFATDLVAYLAPFVPFLVTAGEGAATRAGEQFGTEAWEGAKRVWARLRPAVEADMRASAAVQELSTAPDDDELRVQLKLQLRRLLDDDDELLASLSRLVGAAPPTVSITGIVNEGDVRGGTQYGIVGEIHHGQQRRGRR